MTLSIAHTRLFGSPRTLAVIMAWALLGLAAGCARQEAPTGGPQDVRPPVVIATSPTPLSTVSEVDGGVRFDFDERISERVSGGTLDAAVTVSPRVGEVSVKHGRRSLTIEMEGGFVPGVVYRVTLNPVISDLFGNRLADPFELVFSTGPEPVPTTLAGEIWDRVTGMAVRDAVVLAVDEDGLLHEARTDDQGIFAFRYVGAGGLSLSAFEDQNRNVEVDSTETQGTFFTELSVGDTALVDFAILEPDTSAAILADAEVLDSVTVVLEFDDFLSTDLDVVRLQPSVVGPDGAVPIETLFSEAGYASWVESVTDSLATLDSIDAANAPPPQPPALPETDPVDPADPAPAETPPDSAAAVAVVDPAQEAAEPNTGAGRPGVGTIPLPPRRPTPTVLERVSGEQPGMNADGRVLPGRRLVLRLESILPYDVEYTVEISGVVNINGLDGGGGEVTFLFEQPEEPEADTLGLDSLGIPIDTGAVVDTVRVDTLDLSRLFPGGAR